MDFPVVRETIDGVTGEPIALVESANFSPEEKAALSEAVRLLEYESFTARVTYALGRGVSGVGAFMPDTARKFASRAATAALQRAMVIAIGSLQAGNVEPARTRLHKSLLTASGAAGGAFGLAALPMELPFSTILVLRAIADVARAEGEDLSQPEAAIACMEVFALGGRTSVDDQMNSAYFALRAVLASSVSEAAKHVARHGLSGSGAPVMVRLLSQISGRFGVVVSQKIAAQSIPVIGAIGGGAINYAFAEHFTGLARGHFTVRRLERAYGREAVRGEYERLAAIWRTNRGAVGKA
ncbi:MAG: EcsC family protein [Beijerinckiaceae bacterium]|nr:EcsC family protein [Beijerinckiaceae bacterium]